VIEIKCKSIKTGFLGSIIGTFGRSWAILASLYSTPSEAASALA
jgi:hypothetical protein